MVMVTMVLGRIAEGWKRNPADAFLPQLFPNYLPECNLSRQRRPQGTQQRMEDTHWKSPHPEGQYHMGRVWLQVSPK